MEESNLRNMMAEYEAKIEFLEKRVSELELRNSGLKQCLSQHMEFSTKLSNIIFEMDCLLEKKGKEIAQLQAELENRNKVQVDDFTIDLGTENDSNEARSDCKSEKQAADAKDYVIELGISKLDLERSSDGLYHCPDTECRFKNMNQWTVELHFLIHSGEKAFQCKLCNAQFKQKTECLAHIRQHDDKFKIKCSLCDEKFTRRQLLIIHGNRYHDGGGYVLLKRAKRSAKRPRS